MKRPATTPPAIPKLALSAAAPLGLLLGVGVPLAPLCVGDEPPELVVVLAAAPLLVTLKVSLSARMPVLVVLVDASWIWYLDPGAATTLAKEYLLSAVLTRSLITVVVAPEDEEWSTSTMEKLEGSVATLVHSTVLDWEKSQASVALGWVIVRAGGEMLAYGRGLGVGWRRTLGGGQEADCDAGLGEHFDGFVLEVWV